MDKEKEDIEVIFIVSHIRDNTTPAERYKSLIRRFTDQDINVKIIEFDYPWKENTWMGHEIENVDVLDDQLKDRLTIVEPTLNPFQRLIFNLFSEKRNSLAKLLHILYQVIYQKDIKHPGNRYIPPVSSNAKGYVVVSGGPFGIFSYADFLARSLNYKLVLDYRDPWTFGYRFVDTPYLIYKFKVLLNRRKEKSLLNKAALVTTVSETLKSFYPEELQNKIKVIPNGSNSDVSVEAQSAPLSFNIVYAGTVYQNQLIDDVFFRSIVDFLKDKDSALIKLQFLGSYHNDNLRDKLEEFNLIEFAQITKRLKKQELNSYFSDASVFLHLRYGEQKGIITSKQADYLAFRKPILLPVSDSGDLAESIITNHSGFVCNTVEENVAVLTQLYEKFKSGESLIIPQSEEMLRRNSRAYIAKQFVDAVLNS